MKEQSSWEEFIEELRRQPWPRWRTYWYDRDVRRGEQPSRYTCFEATIYEWRRSRYASRAVLVSWSQALGGAWGGKELIIVTEKTRAFERRVTHDLPSVLMELTL